MMHIPTPELRQPYTSLPYLAKLVEYIVTGAACRQGTLANWLDLIRYEPDRGKGLRIGLRRTSRLYAASV